MPDEQNVIQAYTRKTKRYSEPQFRGGKSHASIVTKLEARGWKVHLFPVEVCARGHVAFSVRRCMRALGFQNAGAFLPFGLHLPPHRFHQIQRWRDILDLDTSDLHAPWVGRFIDDIQKVRVDLSRSDKSISRSIEPITVRILVMVRLSVAWRSWRTS